VASGSVPPGSCPTRPCSDFGPILSALRLLALLLTVTVQKIDLGACGSVPSWFNVIRQPASAGRYLDYQTKSLSISIHFCPIFEPMPGALDLTWPDIPWCVITDITGMRRTGDGDGEFQRHPNSKNKRHSFSQHDSA
jgi:hypothetical protein